MKKIVLFASFLFGALILVAQDGTILEKTHYDLKNSEQLAQTYDVVNRRAEPR